VFRGPLESAMRHRGLTLAPVFLFVLAGVAIGLLRDPVYDSEARVSVGRVDAPVYTLDDMLIANATLARNYARVLVAEPVVAPAARRVGISREEALDRLSGSPVPGSSLISVIAEGGSDDEAVALANAGARRLIVYVEELNRRQATNNLLSRFRSAAARYDRAQERLRRLRRDPRASRRELAAARLDFFTEQARTEGTRTQYRNNEGGLPSKGLLQLAVPAVDADSDRWSVLQRLALIGLGAGLVAGLGLALLRENRRLIARAEAWR
jgi:hypothetical protein